MVSYSWLHYVLIVLIILTWRKEWWLRPSTSFSGLACGFRGNEANFFFKVGVSVSLGFTYLEMGVDGLTTYIKNNRSLWKQIELSGRKLIIDGDNLCYHLYNENGFDCRCGGQYEEFYSEVIAFFDALESQRVKSFVVLDGAYDKSDKKLETKKKRAQDRIETSERLFKNESIKCSKRLFNNERITSEWPCKDEGIKYSERLFKKERIKTSEWLCKDEGIKYSERLPKDERIIETSEWLCKNERSPGGNTFLLPLLAKLVFVQALRDHRIEFAVSDW